MTKTQGATLPLPTGDDDDEALDTAAHGHVPTSDLITADPDVDPDADGDVDGDEIDAMGRAAGVTVPEGERLGGPDEIARRDAHRWELDPGSAEDADARDRLAGGDPATRLRESHDRSGTPGGSGPGAPPRPRAR